MSTGSPAVFSISDFSVAIMVQIAFTYLYKPVEEEIQWRVLVIRGKGKQHV